MRQKIIKTGACTLRAVEVPEGYRPLSVYGGCKFYVMSEREGTFFEDLPTGNWELLCKASEVTEEIAGNIVEQAETPDRHAIYYEDYTDAERCFCLSRESFRSLLRANGVLFDNPYESVKRGLTFSNEHKNEWEIAQEKVWNKDRTYIFKLKEQ